MGRLVGHAGLLLDLRCDARYFPLHSEGLKRSGLEPSGDNVKCCVLAAHLLEVREASSRHLLEALETTATTKVPKGPVDGSSEEFRDSSCVEWGPI